MHLGGILKEQNSVSFLISSSGNPRSQAGLGRPLKQSFSILCPRKISQQKNWLGQAWLGLSRRWGVLWSVESELPCLSLITFNCVTLLNIDGQTFNNFSWISRFEDILPAPLVVNPCQSLQRQKFLVSSALKSIHPQDKSGLHFAVQCTTMSGCFVHTSVQTVHNYSETKCTHSPSSK